MIKIVDVKKEYHTGKTIVNALKGINLEIEQGEFTTISGSSGSGKSTLLNMLGCLDEVTNGDIIMDGIHIKKLSEKEKNNFRLNYIGFIFQSFNLVPVLTIYENIELPLLIKKDVSAEERKKRINHFIKAVGLEEYAKRLPSELSGGQRQRVAVARALVTKPKVVLADEPTANLDSKTGIAVIDLMHDISRKEGTTFIFSTHDPKVVNRANRVIKLEDGQVIEEGNV